VRRIDTEAIFACWKDDPIWWLLAALGFFTDRKVFNLKSRGCRHPSSVFSLKADKLIIYSEEEGGLKKQRRKNCTLTVNKRRPTHFEKKNHCQVLPTRH